MSKPPLSYVPLLCPTLAMIGGIITAYFLPGLWWLIALLVIFVATTLFLKRPFLLSLITFAIIGYLLASEEFNYSSAESIEGKEVTFEGEVLEAKEAERGQSLLIKIHKLGANSDSLLDIHKFKLMLSVPDFTPEYYEGSIIRALAIIEKVNTRTDLPDEFSYSESLYRQGIHYRAITPQENISILVQPSGVKASLRELNRACADLLYRSHLSVETKTFLAATLLGRTDFTSTQVRETFAQAGIAHILALSGLHVSIIALVLSIIFFPLYLVGQRKLALAIVIVILWIYAISTGLSPSVVRSVIMTTIFLLSIVIQRMPQPLNSLLFAAMVILLFSPSALFSISFQLSFIAVAFIILFADKLNPISKKKRTWHALFTYISVSTAAMMGTSIVSIIYFHSFPVYFLIANILASLLLPWMLGIGLLHLIFLSLGIELTVINSFLDLIYNAVILVANLSNNLPGAVSNDIYIYNWLILPYFFTLLLLWFALSKDKFRYWFAFIISAIITSNLFIFSPSKSIEKRIFLTYRTDRTDIAIPSDTALTIMTTSQSTLLPDVENEAKTLYGEYIGLRSIPKIVVKKISEDNDKIGAIQLAFADSCLTNLPSKCNYLMLCRGVRSSLKEITANTSVDTLILSSDFDKRRRSKYIQQAKELNIPTISVSDRKFSLPLE